jgi:hypothetical protein
MCSITHQIWGQTNSTGLLAFSANGSPGARHGLSRLLLLLQLPRAGCLKSPIRTGVRLTSDVAHVTSIQESPVGEALHANRPTGLRGLRQSSKRKMTEAITDQPYQVLRQRIADRAPGRPLRSVNQARCGRGRSVVGSGHVWREIHSCSLSGLRIAVLCRQRWVVDARHADRTQPRAVVREVSFARQPCRLQTQATRGNAETGRTIQEPEVLPLLCHLAALHWQCAVGVCRP